MSHGSCMNSNKNSEITDKEDVVSMDSPGYIIGNHLIILELEFAQPPYTKPS